MCESQKMFLKFTRYSCLTWHCFFLQVKSILVNIFGGIVDCSIVANGITSAYKRLNVNVPVVVRLEGEALFNYYFLMIDKNNISSLIRTCLKLSRLFRSLPAPVLSNCLIG